MTAVVAFVTAITIGVMVGRMSAARGKRRARSRADSSSNAPNPAIVTAMGELLLAARAAPSTRACCCHASVTRPLPRTRWRRPTPKSSRASTASSGKTWASIRGFAPWRCVSRSTRSACAEAHRVLWEAEDLQREVDASQTTTPLDQAVWERRDREAARARVDAALQRIHARYAQAIRLRVLEEKPREEVAAVLGVTPATFDVLLHRATAALQGFARRRRT